MCNKSSIIDINWFINQVKGVSWLPYPLPPQCRFIFTINSSDQTYASIGARKDAVLLSIPASLPSMRQNIEAYKTMARYRLHSLPYWQGAYLQKHAPPWANTLLSLDILGMEMQAVEGGDRLRLESVESYGYTLSLINLVKTILSKWRLRYRYGKEDSDGPGKL